MSMCTNIACFEGRHQGYVNLYIEGAVWHTIDSVHNQCTTKQNKLTSAHHRSCMQV